MKKLLFLFMIAASFEMSAQVSVQVSVVDTQFHVSYYDFVVQVHGGPSDSILINGMRIPSPLFRGANYGTTYVISVGSSSDTLCVPNPPAFTMPAVTFLSDSSFTFDVPPFPFFLDPFRILIINDTLIDPYNMETVPFSGRTLKISHGGRIKNIIIQHNLSADISVINPYYSDTDTVTLILHDTTFVHDTVNNYIHDTITVMVPIDYYTLSLVSEQPTMGIVVGSGTYTDSTVVEIAAIPIDSYRFVEWSDGNTESIRHVLVSEDIGLTASFVADEIGITDVVASGATITVQGNTIMVQGAEGKCIRVFDAIGRLLATRTADTHTFRVPTAGVYLIQVGDGTAQRVVIN